MNKLLKEIKCLKLVATIIIAGFIVTLFTSCGYILPKVDENGKPTEYVVDEKVETITENEDIVSQYTEEEQWLINYGFDIESIQSDDLLMTAYYSAMVVCEQTGMNSMWDIYNYSVGNVYLREGCNGAYEELTSIDILSNFIDNYRVSDLKYLVAQKLGEGDVEKGYERYTSIITDISPNTKKNVSEIVVAYTENGVSPNYEGDGYGVPTQTVIERLQESNKFDTVYLLTHSATFNNNILTGDKVSYIGTYTQPDKLFSISEKRRVFYTYYKTWNEWTPIMDYMENDPEFDFSGINGCWKLENNEKVLDVIWELCDVEYPSETAAIFSANYEESQVAAYFFFDEMEKFDTPYCEDMGEYVSYRFFSGGENVKGKFIGVIGDNVFQTEFLCQEFGCGWSEGWGISFTIVNPDASNAKVQMFLSDFTHYMERMDNEEIQNLQLQTDSMKQIELIPDFIGKEGVYSANVDGKMIYIQISDINVAYDQISYCVYGEDGTIIIEDIGMLGEGQYNTYAAVDHFATDVLEGYAIFDWIWSEPGKFMSTFGGGFGDAMLDRIFADVEYVLVVE